MGVYGINAKRIDCDLTSCMATELIETNERFPRGGDLPQGWVVLPKLQVLFCSHRHMATWILDLDTETRGDLATILGDVGGVLMRRPEEGEQPHAG